jgi:hypothetical protein
MEKIEEYKLMTKEILKYITLEMHFYFKEMEKYIKEDLLNKVK